MVGQFLELSIAAQPLAASFEFYRALGFASLPVSDSLPHPYLALFDGTVTIGLHEREQDGAFLTFVRPQLRDYVRAVKACFRAFRTGSLDHHGDFYDLDFITPQWSAGPIDAPDPKVDVAAVNPWMLRMAGEVADGVHVHPLGEPGYIARHVVPNVAEGAEKSGRSPSDVAVIVPVMTIVGDTDEERDKERESVRFSMSFYGSTPNYSFIWDQAGFEGTTARIREKQKAGDFTGMAAQITDDHIAKFAVESTWDGLADSLRERYDGIASRIVLYNALGDPERVERYGEVAQRVRTATRDQC
jgi:probable F420-dependent oxidoreductase